MRFKNRKDAGELLAQALLAYKNSPDTIVVGLARGGVIVAQEIAKTLDIPLDVISAMRIGSPADPEFTIGALTAGGTTYVNKPLVDSMGLSIDGITPSIEAEQKEANRRDALYHDARKPMELKDKTVILVDDGFATGATLRVALLAIRALGAKKIVVAVPVMPIESGYPLKNSVDELVCLYQADVFEGVNQFYEEFPPVSDDEVVDALS